MAGTAIGIDDVILTTERHLVRLKMRSVELIRLRSRGLSYPELLTTTE